MTRDELQFLLDKNHYLPGGTQEACVKILDFLKHQTDSKTQTPTSYSSVNIDEFLDSVRLLTAFASQQPDCIPKRWHCDRNCLMVTAILCSGEYGISPSSNERCPFFVDDFPF